MAGATVFQQRKAAELCGHVLISMPGYNKMLGEIAVH